jgi:hypothetical protein
MVRCYPALILFLIVFEGCTKQPQYIATVKESNNLYIVETDTLQPSYMVYRLDSFQTSGGNRAIIGENTDPYFGITKAKTYCRFNIAPDNYLLVGSTSESYDSIMLIMHTDRSYNGDTTLPWTASVHALSQDLDAVNGNYYNHQQLSVSATELANASTIVRPHVDDSVRIRLSDSFGGELFNLYKQKNANVSSNDMFQRYFKGLCIEPGAGSKVIYGFNAADTGTLIRLYYHDDQGIHISKTLDFKCAGGNYQFNNIINDPSGTVTEGVVAGHDTPSDQLGHQIFVNDLAGVGTKFTIPTIKTIPTIPNYVRLQSAQLKLVPVPGSFNSLPLIGHLGLGASNQSSTALTPLYTLDNTSIQNGNLSIDLLKGTETSYGYELTAFSQSEILSTVYTTGTLYFQSLSSTNGPLFSLNRLVAADNANPASPSKVILEILFFKK